MKRDMDLIRLLLLEIASNNDTYGIDSPVIDGYSEGQIAGHLKMLLDGGLIEVKNVAEEWQQEDLYGGINLTWDGQDFIDAAHPEPLWTKAKETLVTSGIGFTMQSLLVWLKAQAIQTAQSLL
jgi:hypothetical protein